METKELISTINDTWDKSIIPALCDYIKIPNQSPHFDPQWNSNGLQEKAVQLMVDWVAKQQVVGLKYRVEKESDRTPLIFITVDGTDDTQETVLLYGHLDKQPPMTETWRAGLGPWSPVIENGKLYGRGGADDGYAVFGAITAIKALQLHKQPHARCVIIIEACEESGSFDLPHYIDKLAAEIGTPGLVICLDSGSGNYDQFWLTTSLRGMVVGTLRVKILNEGVHSGAGSGIVPDSFRLVRKLISRIEDEDTGVLKVPELFCEIPEKHVQYAAKVAETLGDEIYKNFPFVTGKDGNVAKPVDGKLQELCLNRTWKPTLVVTGVDGIPALGSAGNVLRTHTAFKLSIRVPPGANAQKAATAVKTILEQDPPYGALVSFDVEKASNGWAAPPLDAWLEHSLNKASETVFGKDARFMGEGGSIPFMGMLGEKFPGVQFVITGLLGPNSNAHGPNEFLKIDFGKGVTSSVAMILADHYQAKVTNPKKIKKA